MSMGLFLYVSWVLFNIANAVLLCIVYFVVVTSCNYPKIKKKVISKYIPYKEDIEYECFSFFCFFLFFSVLFFGLSLSNSIGKEINGFSSLLINGFSLKESLLIFILPLFSVMGNLIVFLCGKKYKKYAEKKFLQQVAVMYSFAVKSYLMASEVIIMQEIIGLKKDLSYTYGWLFMASPVLLFTVFFTTNSLMRLYFQKELHQSESTPKDHTPAPAGEPLHKDRQKSESSSQDTQK
ncbi:MULTISPECIES: hypothetical protein [unclassified Saccharibacter]|uniref:hypothetical protein n=1 Tax=unclassified Saccharibacter TaxID=2648722 RepID=UPI00132C576B|nr:MULTISPECIES: hypothetical protein [unclassified Saccharibacter]MXV35858.1 hypothetical protein [Saccharibacter sp. EH611]MXV57978.1 hypothetical protein [Saccharibacter sp. EH70]MXV66373.1 hypothetical protein [Saccharibacter sp. EH60]